jgi:hypothetical protein
MSIFKLNKIVKKAIDVPLMDITNVANLIMDTVVSKNKHFFFNFYTETNFLKMYFGIPHYIYGIVLAKNKEDAFELLKSKLKTIVIGEKSSYNLETKDITYKDVTLEELTIEDFDKSGTLYNSEYTVLCEPRIDYLLILQGFYNDGLDLTYTLCEYKYKCKPQKEYVNMYEDRHDYYSCNSYYPDKRLDTEYNEYSIEEAQSCIQYLF